mgnify:CR=1 FL=1
MNINFCQIDLAPLLIQEHLDCKLVDICVGGSANPRNILKLVPKYKFTVHV